MSYDLRVATHDKPGQDEVESWLHERSGLSVEGRLNHGGVSFSRVLGKSSKPSFEVSAPTPVLDPEDIDEELATTTVAPRWFLEVSAPYGGPDQDKAAARAFAKHLAENCRGAAFDPQSDKVLWPPKTRRRVNVPSTPERIRVLNLRWFFEGETMTDSQFPAEMLRLFRTHLADALPRRYGEYEPPRQSFQEGGEKAFVEFCEYVRNEPLNTMHWKTRSPCFGGTLSFPSRYAKPEDGRPTGYLAINLDGRVMVEGEPWLVAVNNLFSAVATEMRAFYAAAYVERGVEARRGSLWYGAGTEHISIMGPAWKGLPREPVWMSYFDASYAAELDNELGDFETTSINGGRLLRFGETPLDQDEIRERYSWFSETVLTPPRKPVEIPLQLAEGTDRPSIKDKFRRLLGRD